jgi:hypothetical protein
MSGFRFSMKFSAKKFLGKISMEISHTNQTMIIEKLSMEFNPRNSSGDLIHMGTRDLFYNNN